MVPQGERGNYVTPQGERFKARSNPPPLTVLPRIARQIDKNINKSIDIPPVYGNIVS